MNQLQVLVWVLTRREEPVRWAAHQPGATRLLDLNLDSRNLDKEPANGLMLRKKTGEPVYLPELEEPRYFESEEELLITAMAERERVCSLDKARKEIIVARDDGRLRSHYDPATGSEFFDRAAVLDIWKELPGEPAADAPETENPSATPAQGKKPAGRPPEWDWQAIYAEAQSRLDQHDPSRTPKLLSLVHEMQGWCRGRYGKHPSETTLKDRLRPLVEEMSGTGERGEKDGN